MANVKILVIGLDGVGFDLVEQLSDERLLPNLSALMARGIHGPLASTTPPMTLPAWSSFMTGAEPSSHGLPDFTIRSGYRVRFAGAQERRLPTLFTHLENCGLTASQAWFPATYPPVPLAGYHISGWDSPVTATGDRSFVHPPELHDELLPRFGNDHLSFDAIDEFRDSANWYSQTARALPERVHRRADMAEWLIRNKPTDIAAFYFGEADTAAHHFWAFHDPNSPRRPKAVEPQLENVLKSVYAALDESVGRLVSAAEPEAVVLLSDHGSGGTSHIAVHLNRALESAGLLTFKRRRSALTNTEILRSKAPGLLPPKWRRSLFRLAGGMAPAVAESFVRFSGIDWKNTLAFSEELTYSPSIWFNQIGREPKGMLPYGHRKNAARAVAEALMGLHTPDGKPLVKRVVQRENLHRGPYAHLFADLHIEFRSVDGYTPVCLPSRGMSGNPVTTLRDHQLLGRKGRSLPGCHTSNGVLIAAGKYLPENKRVCASIVDVAPTITALADAPRAPWFEGHEVVPRTRTRTRTRPQTHEQTPYTRDYAISTDTPGYSSSEERLVAERLKRLGYLE